MLKLAVKFVSAFGIFPSIFQINQWAVSLGGCLRTDQLERTGDMRMCVHVSSRSLLGLVEHQPGILSLEQNK